MKTYILIAPEK